MSETVARFDGRSDDYARYRPTYPPAAIDEILRGLAAPEGLTVADIGAGTGISSALLRERGAHVVAVEPNAEMRAVARANGLDVRDASADALPFEDASLDLVTAFQAFHWFARPDVVAEFARVLRPRGRVAIVWNERDDDDPFTRGYGDAVDGFAKRTVFAARDGIEQTPHELLAGLFDSSAWTLRTGAFAHVQRLDREGLFGRVRSTSYAPREGEAYERMRAELERLYAAYRDDRGTIALRMFAETYVLDRTAGGAASASEVRA